MVQVPVKDMVLREKKKLDCIKRIMKRRRKKKENRKKAESEERRAWDS